MKLKQNHLHILLFLGLLFSGCSREQFLDDFVPIGISTPTTIEDYRLLLDQVDAPLDFSRVASVTNGFDEKHNITAYINDNVFINEALNSAVTFPSPTPDIIRAYTFQDQLYPSVTNSDPNWDNYYTQIYLANIILDGLETVSNGTINEINALKAEARLHRAYAYFNLVNIYALHYTAATADDNLGVPIRQGTALEGLDLARASVAGIYNLIISDIKESIDDLPDSQPPTLLFRPSKVAAYGLLSRTYLFQGEYNLALQEVNNALNINSTLRDVSTDPVSATQISNGVTQLPAILENSELLWYKEFNGLYLVSEDFFNLYEASDLRTNWFISAQEAINIDIPAWLLGASVDNGSLTSDGINTPELYLIRAECNARLGNLDLANDDINTLREKRFTSPTPININNQDELLAFVKAERRKELVNGTHRFFDIKRYNALDNDNITLTHTFNGETFTLTANDPKWALPIAPIYISFNPEIIQNPRN